MLKPGCKACYSFWRCEEWQVGARELKDADKTLLISVQFLAIPRRKNKQDDPPRRIRVPELELA